MLIFPAIDLHDGRVVQLKQGDYGQVTVYGDDPLVMAERFMEQGAKQLHAVDLDAAKDGAQKNLPLIEKLAKLGLFLEVGGGCRDEESIRRYLDAGVGRAIVGTLAAERPEELRRLAALFPGRLAVGVDAKDGKVATHGWRVITDLDAWHFAASLPGLGVETAIFTDVTRDGMMEGPNFAAYEKLVQIEGLAVIASGGVSGEEDVKRLKEIGVDGLIAGTAIYDGRLDLRRAIALGRTGGA